MINKVMHYAQAMTIAYYNSDS